MKLGPIQMGPGFNAPLNQPYLDEAINQASLSYFKKEALTFGEGGSIPLMNELQHKYFIYHNVDILKLNFLSPVF